MMRKYDLRNKKNFIIILVLAIAVIGIFSLFIYQYKHNSKIEYTVETGSVIQDTNKNTINIEEDATLKKRWNGNFYLIYQDKKINLGKNVIVYNTITEGMKLYGKFYEIKSDGNVDITEDETILANTTKPRFYKIADREYLLIDKQIFSDDKSIETSNYMLVELDKMGNAKLSNNKLNMKTITETTLLTSEYSFDIAKEVLKFEDTAVDLKKIIGSSNEYKEKEKEEEKDDTTENNTIYNGSGNNGVVNNNTNTGNGSSSIEELIKKTKMTSVIRVQEGLTQIDMDYVVYDPYNEYKSVYVEVTKPDKIEVIHLSKTDTHIVFENLIPNTKYKFNFVYTTAKEDGSIEKHIFDTMGLTTKMPGYSVEVQKISYDTGLLTCKVNLQEGYKVNTVNVSLTFKYRVTNSETNEVTIQTKKLTTPITINTSAKTVTATFSLEGYEIDIGSIATLSVDSVSVGGITLNIGSKSNFKMGG